MNSLSHPTRFINFISLFLFIVPISDAYLDYPTYNIKADFRIVMIITLTFNILNWFGSLYIFYRTYLRWKYDYDKILSLSIRFPFYIAITDFLVSSVILIDFMYSAPKESTLLKGGVITWPSPYCEIIGFFNVFSILMNILLGGTISLTTWLRVVQEYYFDWGKYDYKIWCPIIFVSFFIPLISVREFGEQKYWCGIKYHDSTMISILMFTVIILTLLTIIICYAHILKTIHDIKEDDSSINSKLDSQHTNIERKTLNKVLTYVLVFLFQYIPLMISDIFEFLKFQYVVLYALSPSAISIGGLSNLIQYIYHEGFYPFRIISSNNNGINLEVSEQSNSYDSE